MADNTPATTGTTLAAMADAHKVWQKTVDVFDQSEDFFREFEGKAANSLIVVKEDTSKGRGQEVVFTNLSGLYKEPTHGDDNFNNRDKFEKLRISDYSLTVDWLRHAVSYTRRAEEKMGLRGELVSKVPDELGKWMGRQKTEKLQMMFRERVPEANYVFAGSANSVDDITLTDTINYNDIQALGYTLKPKGGRPAMVGRSASGRPIHSYCFVGVSDALLGLKQDPTYRQALRDAQARGPANYIFSGDFAAIDGHVIKEFIPVDHDGVGAIGSPQNPKAELGVALASATTAQDIKGGGNATDAAETDILFYKWFPEYTYEYIKSSTTNSDALSDSNDDFYVVVYNVPGSTDAGKWGFYRCDTNDGNKLTMKNEANNSTTGAGGRLGAADSGVKSTKIGDVVWNSDRNTETHDEGSLVFLANRRGVPLCVSYMLGGASAFRGYGMWRNKRSEEGHEGTGDDAFIKDVFCTSVFGQQPREDRKGRVPGVICYVAACNYPGININPYYG